METTENTFGPTESKIYFQIKKLGFLTIKGTVTGFTGGVIFNKGALSESRFNVCISPETINTGNTKRDEHLRSKDFFHVEAFPEICFQSSSILPHQDGYKVNGDLSMLGITHKVAIPFTFSEGDLVGQFSINRMDYKLGEKFPVFIVGKNIQVSIKCKII